MFRYYHSLLFLGWLLALGSEIFEGYLFLEVFNSCCIEEPSNYAKILASLYQFKVRRCARVYPKIEPECKSENDYKFRQQIFAEYSNNWHRKAEGNNFVKIVFQKKCISLMNLHTFHIKCKHLDQSLAADAMDNEEIDLVAQKNADDSFSNGCFHGEYLNNYRLEYVSHHSS